MLFMQTILLLPNSVMNRRCVVCTPTVKLEATVPEFHQWALLLGVCGSTLGCPLQSRSAALPKNRQYFVYRYFLFQKFDQSNVIKLM